MRLSHRACLFIPALIVAPACGQSPMFTDGPGSPIAVSYAPSVVGFGHFDGDDHVDVVVAFTDPPSLSVLNGDGRGGFQQVESRRKTPLPYRPTEMAVDDINGDGYSDVAVGNHDTYDVYLFFGDGQSGFDRREKAVTMRKGNSPHTHGLRLADVNNDGFPDLLTVNHDNNDFSVALGNGDGAFVPAARSPFATGVSPYPAGVGDLNSDGLLDAAVPSTSRSAMGSIAIHIGDAEEGFALESVSTRTPRPWFVDIGDVNGDGVAEVVAAHWESSKVTVLSRDPRAAAFEELDGSPFDLGISVFEVIVRDVNRDGASDIIGVGGNRVAVLLGSESGEFRRAEGSPFQIGGGAWRLAMTDLNQDGKPDIATGNEENRSVSILLAR